MSAITVTTLLVMEDDAAVLRSITAALRDICPDTPIIAVSGTDNLEDAIEAVQRGAWDYVTKPILDMTTLELAVSRSLERGRLRRENRAYQEHLKQEECNAQMTIHRFQPVQYYNAIGAYEPALRIAPGDTVITTTVDAWGRDAANQQVAARPNPQTGPFYVEGAAPGDTLVLHLDRLIPNRSYGYTKKVVAPNVVEPDYVPELPWLASTERLAEWRVDAQAGVATLITPETKLGRLTLPLAPMLGCFGVAPEAGQAISTATAGKHGGNMDYRGFVSGVTVYLPVSVPGALLFLGDGHALQGDGEIVGTGIEISFDVQFTVDLHPGKHIGWPRGENAEYIFTVGNARPLDQAVQHATTEMLRWLQEDYELDAVGAHILMGQCVEYDLGNIYDPAYTMVCKLAKRWLKRVA